MDQDEKEKRIVRILKEIFSDMIDLENQTYLDWSMFEDYRTNKYKCNIDSIAVMTTFSNEIVFEFCNELELKKKFRYTPDVNYDYNLCNENPNDYIDNYPILKVEENLIDYLEKKLNKKEFWESSLLRYINEIFGSRLTRIVAV